MSSWTTLLVIQFSCRQSCEGQGVGLDDPCESLPTGDIFCVSVVSTWEENQTKSVRFLVRLSKSC